MIVAAGIIWVLSSGRSSAPRVAARDAGAEIEASNAPPEPATYVSPPAVDHYPIHEGRYRTEVRFNKSEGPWQDQLSHFDLWFDGEVEPEFQSRGFEDPVQFEVKTPEPLHFAIDVTSPPWGPAAYVSFTFKSAKPVTLVRSDVRPKRDASPRDR
jgi:hypothetical protein